MSGRSGKAIGVSGDYLVNNGADTRFLDISFVEETCKGYFEFAARADDSGNQDCIDRFMAIIAGCNKGPSGQKYGGSLTDVCTWH
jgi:hypothetical protein